MNKNLILIGLIILLLGCSPAMDKQALLQLITGSTLYQNNKDFVQIGF